MKNHDEAGYCYIYKSFAKYGKYIFKTQKCEEKKMPPLDTERNGNANTCILYQSQAVYSLALGGLGASTGLWAGTLSGS